MFFKKTETKEAGNAILNERGAYRLRAYHLIGEVVEARQRPQAREGGTLEFAIYYRGENQGAVGRWGFEYLPLKHE